MKYDITNMRFGQLKALRVVGTKHKELLWECECSCGDLYNAASYSLRSGKTTCCRKCSYFKISKANMIHGESQGFKHSSLYSKYTNMKTRCYNKNYYLFQHYGGKGVTVCDEWMGKDGFLKFREWAMNNGYEDNLSLDRIKNDKPYCPENCRWATMTAQQNNRTNNRVLTVNGEDDTMANMARKYNVKYHTIQARLQRGWSHQDAVLGKSK